MRRTGVTARGIIMPIFKTGDDLPALISQGVWEASQQEGFALHDQDIVAVTEAVVARAQGNYATCQQIAQSIRSQMKGEVLGLVFPILSRNRFSILLKAMAMAAKKVVIQLSYPCDEVGNGLLSWDLVEEKEVDPWRDSYTEEEFRSVFGRQTVHPFTGVDYIEYYKSFGENIEIVFSNDPRYILNFTKEVLVCSIHSRFRDQRKLQKAGATTVFRMDQVMTAPIDGSGYNETYGILGSNKATEESVKLFPRDCKAFVEKLQEELAARTGKKMEVMVYGDGGFKDPQGGIWELADPVVSPAFTSGLAGTPNELKIKYLADTEFAHLSGKELNEALRQKIREKHGSLKGEMASQGTTPRQITDLVGSLSDLVSGSGDRGTPVVLIQGYFSNYASEE